MIRYDRNYTKSSNVFINIVKYILHIIFNIAATNNYKPTYQFPDDDDDTKSLDGSVFLYMYIIQLILIVLSLITSLYNY